MTPEPSPSPTRLTIPSAGPATWDVIAQWVAIGLLTTGTLIFIIFVADKIFSWNKKREIKPFYLWLAAIAFFGGLLSFFLPIAINSGFNKGDDGPLLRQALLYTTGGVLGVITLGETHRKNNQEKEKNENDHIRQVHAERRSRYAAAVGQLADKKATVRLGGIYTLVGLVDEWLADSTLSKEEQQKEGQVIINNLCSYIRSPFPLAERREVLEKDQVPGDYDGSFTKDRAQLRREQDVRRTIFEEMSEHSSILTLAEGKKISISDDAWSGFKFDFSRAPIFYPLNDLTIEQGQFSSARFYGEADFRDTEFTKDADFRSAQFTGNADFRGAQFAGGTHFRDAKFTGGAHFMGAKFTGYANFRDAKFNRYANFGNAKFIGGAYFRDAKFTENANFRTAKFTGNVYFRTAKFTGNAYFRTAKFTGNANFRDAKFTGNANFRDAKFTGNAYFKNAKFTENAHFMDTKFTGETNFNGVYFEKYAPTFANESGPARFSAQVIQKDCFFSVRKGSKPIHRGTTALPPMSFAKIPLGAVLFDPASWDEEKQKYTRISEPAKT